MSLVKAARSSVIYAFFRAVESNRPANDRLFHDPYAKLFLKTAPILRMWAWLSAYPFFKWFVPWYIDLNWPGSISSVVARTRLIDLMTIKAIQEHDIYQVIILGAGFDTRPYRLESQGVQFVEVDRPVTQSYKKEVLSRHGIRAVIPIDYVPLDFNTQDPEDVIPKLLQRKHYKTLIIWEGAVNNLTAEQGNTMFRYFQGYPSGTRLIFNYVDEKVQQNPRSFFGASRVDKTLKKMNERWRTGMDPAAMSDFLAAYNLRLLYDENATEYRKLYFGKRAQKKMRGYEFLRVAMAELK